MNKSEGKAKRRRIRNKDRRTSPIAEPVGGRSTSGRATVRSYGVKTKDIGIEVPEDFDLEEIDTAPVLISASAKADAAGHPVVEEVQIVVTEPREAEGSWLLSPRIQAERMIRLLWPTVPDDEAVEDALEGWVAATATVIRSMDGAKK